MTLRLAAADDIVAVSVGEVAREVARLAWEHGAPPERVDQLADELARGLRAAGASDVAAAAPGPDERAPLASALAADPTLLAPPAPVVPRLAWRGRATLVVAAPKAGKSTLLGAAVAALTRGGAWLDDVIVSPSRAIVLAPDEHAGETLRRLQALGADLERVRVVVIPAPAPLDLLEALLDAWPAELVVVDSLSEYARLSGGTPDEGAAGEWGAVLRPLVALAHARDVAVAILGHARRADGEYRGSGEIAAAVDAVVTMRVAEGDERARHVTTAARWPTTPWSWRLASDGRVVAADLAAEAADEIDDRVSAHVAAHPGASTSAIVRAVRGRAGDVRDALHRLAAAGAVTHSAGRRGATTWSPAGVSTSSTDPVPGRDGVDIQSTPDPVPPESARDKAGRGRDGVGTGSRTTCPTTPSRATHPKGGARDGVGVGGGEGEMDLTLAEVGGAGRRCAACGATVGPTAELCASCRYSDRRTGEVGA